METANTNSVTHVYVGSLIESDGSSELVIARDDGSVEVYAFQGTEKPELRYNINFGESITGIGIGKISKTEFAEVLVSNFSGKVAGLIDAKSTEIDPFEMKKQ